MQQFSLFQQLGLEITSIIYNNIYEVVVLKLIKIENEIALNASESLRKLSQKQTSWSENINAEIKNFKQNFTCYQMCITILQQISSNSSKSITVRVFSKQNVKQNKYDICIISERLQQRAIVAHNMCLYTHATITIVRWQYFPLLQQSIQ
ncbi:Hypothetical_protein [Hexamita inflata]|uniref:Hypothetical_protein n=1 Tax=Hexamita inflata TaxID=28002 RepID=A0AA86PSH6_9EUKA|nr:Hypothetical protein HINF_LOCUS27879 [Hexamita inflata]